MKVNTVYLYFKGKPNQRLEFRKKKKNIKMSRYRVGKIFFLPMAVNLKYLISKNPPKTW